MAGCHFLTLKLWDDPSGIARFRHNTVIDTDKKQDFDMVQSGTLDITDRHLIIPRRDHANSCRLEPGV